MSDQNFCPYRYRRFLPKDGGLPTRLLFSKEYFRQAECRSSPIRLPREEAAFVSATRDLVTVYSQAFISAEPHDYEPLLAYIDEWGPPLLVGESQLGDYDSFSDEDYFDAFRSACYTSNLILSLWLDDITPKVDITATCNLFAGLAPRPSGSIRLYLDMRLRDNAGKTAPRWGVDTSGLAGYWDLVGLRTHVPFTNIGTFLPVEFSVDPKELKLLDENRNNVVWCKEWLRSKFLTVLADNIAVSKVSTVPHISAGSVSVDFVLHSNLLFVIKTFIDKSKCLCACGCEREVPPGNKKYATSTCYKTVYNKANPCRGIKQTIISRYERAIQHGKPEITFEEREQLLAMIDSLYRVDRKSRDEIKSIVYPKYDEFAQANKEKGGVRSARKD